MSLISALIAAIKVSYKRYKDKRQRKYSMYCMNCDARLTPSDVFTTNIGANNFDGIHLVVSSKCCNDAVGDVDTVQFVKPDDIR